MITVEMNWHRFPGALGLWSFQSYSGRETNGGSDLKNLIFTSRHIMRSGIGCLKNIKHDSTLNSWKNTKSYLREMFRA